MFPNRRQGVTIILIALFIDICYEERPNGSHRQEGHFLMNYYKQAARKVLEIIDKQKGLPSDIFGYTPGSRNGLCVEAVIVLATENSTKKQIIDEYDDDPTCVNDNVRSISIRLNDSKKWTSAKCRGEGMKRLAIAQLGSKEIDSEKLDNALKKHLWQYDYDQGNLDLDSLKFLPRSKRNQYLADVAEGVVQALIECDCPGTKFLDLVKS